MRGIVWVVALAAAACNPSETQQNEAVCATLCRCYANGLPGPEADCTAGCEADLHASSEQSLESCYDCVYSNSECRALENQCLPICAGQDVEDPTVDAFAEPPK